MFYKLYDKIASTCKTPKHHFFVQIYLSQLYLQPNVIVQPNTHTTLLYFLQHSDVGYVWLCMGIDLCDNISLLIATIVNLKNFNFLVLIQKPMYGTDHTNKKWLKARCLFFE